MHSDLITRILSTVWAIDAKSAMSWKMKAVRAIKGDALQFSDAKELREDLKQKTQTYFAVETKDGLSIAAVDSTDSIPKGAVAIMRVNGVIQKESDMCNRGLDSYENELDFYGTNGNVKGVILEVNSPGGTAQGGDVFAAQLGEFEAKYQKPVAVIIKSLAASAAYGMIAHAPRIFVSSPTAEAGSIGTMATFYDDKDWLEAQGVKEIVVRASESFNKNEPYYQAMQGNTELLQSEILDPLNKAFTASVKKGRRGKIDLKNVVKNNGITVPEALSGKVYFGQSIIDAGLADEMGNRDEAYKYIDQRIKEIKGKNSAKAMNKIQTKSSEELQAHKIELEGLLATDSENEDLTAELAMTAREIEYRELKQKAFAVDLEQMDLQAENAELKLQAVAFAEITAELEAIKAEKENLTAEKQAIEQQLAELKAANENLETVAAEIQKLKTENIAYAAFIEQKFNVAPTAIVEGKTTATETPEVKERTAKILTGKEAKAAASIEAKKKLSGKK
jgi:ClpP class serine protease